MLNLKQYMPSGMVVHTFNPETGVRRSLSLRPVHSAEQVLGQPGTRRETLPQKN